MKDKRILFFGLLVLLNFFPHRAKAQRVVIPLDGQWEVEESVHPGDIPDSFSRTTPVPGLTHQARPVFPDVDHYETLTYLKLMVRRGKLPESELIEGMGRTSQERNYFWYHRTFTAPAEKECATLVVNKAQFGTSVWLNGKHVGEHLHCFTPGRFDLGEAIKWESENHLLIRIGAHPGVMPPEVMWGNDAEKTLWTPGIYDRVSLIFSDNPSIESIQVAPRIEDSEIIIQTRLKNDGPACSIRLAHRIRTWKEDRPVGEPSETTVQLAAGEEKVLTRTLPVPGAILWTTENPFLYVLETSTGGDNCTTRFGMREFRFDTRTGLGYLNGEICRWRGASITLHRFFADSLCKGHPWDEQWVRRFLVDIPKKMHWNAFRLCIGPVPQQWLDIADEAGILFQYEYPIWPSSLGGYLTRLWSEEDLEQQIREFVRDNWNHPSVVLWDASNEFGLTGVKWDFLCKELIPRVRSLDLSNRSWENSDCPPDGPDDPFEVHPYWIGLTPEGMKRELHVLGQLGPWPKMASHIRSAHPAIINEYGWLWLHRDGTPTMLSEPVYENMNLTGPDIAAGQRFEAYAYTLASQTEFFRAYREFAGVMYLAYLDGDVPGASTCDNFCNPGTLELEPHFADFMGEAFKPLGVCISFWNPELRTGRKQEFTVMMVNDTKKTARGQLELAWVREDGRRMDIFGHQPFSVEPDGQMTYRFELSAPGTPGNYTLTARATWKGKPWSPVISRRKVRVIAPTESLP